MILGIDIGLHGHFVVISKDNDVITSYEMPTIDSEYDLQSINDIFKDLALCVKYAFIESPIAMPKIPPHTHIKSGYCFGMLSAFLSMHKIPFEVVAPNVWTKTMHKGLSKDMKAKDKSKIIVNRLLPDFNSLTRNLTSLNRDGFMDAYLIARYGKGFYNE